MPAIEKLRILAFCELRSLIRCRRRLLCAVGLPAVTGLVIGLAARTSAGFPSAYGLLLPLLLSSILLAAEPGPVTYTSRRLSPHLLPSPIARGAWALSALLVLAAQSGVYAAAGSLVGPKCVPSAAVFIGALAVSLVVGLASLTASGVRDR